MAEVENRIVINQRHTKFLEPALTAEHIPADLNGRREKHHGIKLPIKTGDRHFVSVSLKFTVGSSKKGRLATVDLQPELLTIDAFKDAMLGPRVELGEKPDSLFARGQFNWNGDSHPGLGAVVVRVLEGQCGWQILPSCKGNLFLRLDARYQWRSWVTGNGSVYFPRRIPYRQQRIALKCHPLACVPLAVKR